MQLIARDRGRVFNSLLNKRLIISKCQFCYLAYLSVYKSLCQPGTSPLGLKGAHPSKALNILCRDSVLWEERRRLSRHRWGSRCWIPSPSQHRAALVELKRAISWCEILSELLAGTLRAKGRWFRAGFPVYMESEVFFSSHKQVINSLQSQEGKSEAVCFHCTKSKLHFLPHLCHSPAMSEKRLVIDFSTRSMKSQNWKPVPSRRALQFPKWKQEEK